MSLIIKPCTLKEANAYVERVHRHNGATQGCKYALAVYQNNKMCGVAICGLPIARRLNDGETIEIRRVCTDGTRNACSKLYGASCRVAAAMGYKKAITYTLETESGASLYASGFIKRCEAGGDDWNVPSRPRSTEENQICMFQRKTTICCKKYRWERSL